MEVILELDGVVASPSCPPLFEQGVEVVLELDGHVASPSCLTLLEQNVEVVLEFHGLVVPLQTATSVREGARSLLLATVLSLLSFSQRCDLHLHGYL